MNWFCGLLLGFIVGVICTSYGIRENQILIPKDDFRHSFFSLDGTLYHVEQAKVVPLRD